MWELLSQSPVLYVRNFIEQLFMFTQQEKITRPIISLSHGKLFLSKIPSHHVTAYGNRLHPPMKIALESKRQKLHAEAKISPNANLMTYQTCSWAPTSNSLFKILQTERERRGGWLEPRGLPPGAFLHGTASMLRCSGNTTGRGFDNL